MAQYIALSGKNGQGKYAIVDDDRYEELKQYKWSLNSVGYVVRSIWLTEFKKSQPVLMHREIMGLYRGDKRHCDHINHLRYDNRVENLRLCNNLQNCHNSTPRIGTSKYKGVQQNKYSLNWIAGIKVNGKHISLGTYRNEKDAALAYDKAVREYFLDFGYLNFPDVNNYINLDQVKKYSKYKGVSWHKNMKRWVAYHRSNGKTTNIGTYDNEDDAYLAYMNYMENKTDDV